MNPSSLLADRWFETFEMETMDLVKSRSDTKRVKIAILDTGVDITHPYLAEKAGSVIHSNSWPTNTASDFSDTKGHGTHVAGLILKLAPGAELYIAKVDDSSEAGSNQDIDSRKVAKVNSNMKALERYTFADSLIGHRMGDRFACGHHHHVVWIYLSGSEHTQCY